MIEWVLDERYRHLHNTHALKESSIFVFEAGESMLADLMYAIEAKWKKLKLFSLPTMTKDGSRGFHPAAFAMAMIVSRSDTGMRDMPNPHSESNVRGEIPSSRRDDPLPGCQPWV